MSQTSQARGVIRQDRLIWRMRFDRTFEISIGPPEPVVLKEIHSPPSGGQAIVAGIRSQFVFNPLWICHIPSDLSGLFLNGLLQRRLVNFFNFLGLYFSLDLNIRQIESHVRRRPRCNGSDFSV